MSTIFSNNWTTGSLLLENAGICDLMSGLGVKDEQVHYTALIGSISLEVNNITTPLALYTDVLYIYKQYLNNSGLNWSFYGYSNPGTTRHPNRVLYNYTAGPQLDFLCISQLDLAIMTSWYDITHGAFP